MNKNENVNLTINTSCHGDSLKTRLVEIYNLYCYLNEQHAYWDSEKRRLENIFEEIKDRARNIKAAEADLKQMKAKIQESFIKDLWSVEIKINTAEFEAPSFSNYTPKEIMVLLIKATEKESFYRRKVQCAQAALDLGRTLLSWDKIELQHLKENS